MTDIFRQKFDILPDYIHNRKMPSIKAIHSPNVFKHKGLFSLADVRKAGISHQTLYRWLNDGKVRRVGRGIFLHSDSGIPPEEHDYAAACAKFGPRSAIGGLTALFQYGLIDQAPHQIWIIVPSQKKTSQEIYRCLRTTTPLKDGIEHKGHYRITNIERTLLESLKFASKIGTRLALYATRRALHDGLTTEARLGRMASKLNLRKVLEKNWDLFQAS